MLLSLNQKKYKNSNITIAKRFMWGAGGAGKKPPLLNRLLRAHQRDYANYQGFRYKKPPLDEKGKPPQTCDVDHVMIVNDETKLGEGILTSSERLFPDGEKTLLSNKNFSGIDKNQYGTAFHNPLLYKDNCMLKEDIKATQFMTKKEVKEKWESLTEASPKGAPVVRTTQEQIEKEKKLKAIVENE